MRMGFSMVGGIAGAIAAVEAFKRFTGVQRLDRHRLCRALRRHRRGRPAGLLLLRPRRFHLRHADRRCPGPSISATASAATLCSSTESLAMAAMFVVLIQRFIARDRFWLDNGFYLTVGWYGLQRFVWEFFKPYATRRSGPSTCSTWSVWACVLYAAADDPQREQGMYDGVARKSAPYLFLGQTTSLCETCLGLGAGQDRRGGRRASTIPSAAPSTA